MDEADLKLRLGDIVLNAENRAMIDACRRMLNTRQGWLYIWGGPGNAKTLALKAMCNHLALAGLTPVVYLKFAQLVDIMRDAYREARRRATGGDPDEIFLDLGYRDRYNRLLKIRVLAVDEFDKARMTGLAEEFRFDFFDDRHEQAIKGQTVTLFASNDPPEALPSPLRSRVNGGKHIVVQNKAGDARPSEAWEVPDA